MKKDKVTISDIAKELNISPISVSRALSGQSGVGCKLREKILKKASEMGYSKIKNNNLNILVLHQKPYLHNNSNFSYIIEGIETSIKNIGANYSFEFVSKESQSKMCLPLNLRKGKFFNGIIFIGDFDFEYSLLLKENVKNQVFYASCPPNYECDSVGINLINLGYKQCEYLIKKGHKNIGFIGNNSILGNTQKLLGISLAHKDYNLSLNNDFIIDSKMNLESCFNTLLNKKELPTAVICDFDFAAIRLIQFLYKNGIKVPDDISVIGNGNTQMSSLSIPALTTMDPNIQYLCKSAVDLLLKRIKNPNKPYEAILVNNVLVERDSVKQL